MENSVVQKMDSIQDTFLRIQDVFFQSPDWRANIKDLHDSNLEFRSIAYESASMSIALLDLKEGNQLRNWLEFLNEVAHAHATQVHVGLGWALAQSLTPPMDYLPLLEPMQRYRVLDGYGYYEGIFRRRRSIINHLKLKLPDATASGALDQGIGRSLWYNSKGDITAAKTTLETFAPERHADLWRGLGIAIAYVGGCNEETLRNIFIAAGTYQKQLATGAAMALISRHYAGFVSADTESVCTVWY
ncbi:MAG TPA: DUF1702 family protein, partial [Chitinophagales bacterium]|nr:DUF1702 family protein [Chitinophagales bacterium]